MAECAICGRRHSTGLGSSTLNLQIANTLVDKTVAMLCVRRDHFFKNIFEKQSFCFTVMIFPIMICYQLHAIFCGSERGLRGNIQALRKHPKYVQTVYLKGSSGDKHIIFVIKAHKICRLVAFLFLFWTITLLKTGCQVFYTTVSAATH